VVWFIDHSKGLNPIALFMKLALQKLNPQIDSAILLVTAYIPQSFALANKSLSGDNAEIGIEE
jgi:hypothetical protein